jgi:hypothetical protein
MIIFANPDRTSSSVAARATSTPTAKSAAHPIDIADMSSSDD